MEQSYDYEEEEDWRDNEPPHETEEHTDDDYDDYDDDFIDDEPVQRLARTGPKKKKNNNNKSVLSGAAHNKQPSAPPRPATSTTTTAALPSASPAPTAVVAAVPPQAPAPTSGHGVQQKNGRNYLKPAHLVYQRFKWDPKLCRLLDYCRIGYLDRFDGILEISYLEFMTIEEEEGVPFHRIRYFKIWETVVWDREARLDLLSPGTWEACMPPHVVATLQPLTPAVGLGEAEAPVDHRPAKKQAVIISSGSFCPIHRQHIHMVEMAKRHLEQKRGYEVLTAIFSPTPDATLRKKFWTKEGFLSARELNPPGFITAHHRARMIELAAEGRTWVKPDLWAAKHGASTAKAREHVYEVFNPSPEFVGAVAADRPPVEVISVFGADTLKLVGRFKNKRDSIVCVVNRNYEFDPQALFDQKVKGMPPSAAADGDTGGGPFVDLVFPSEEDRSCLAVEASATLIRQACHNGEEAVLERLLPAAVRAYIREHNLLPPRVHSSGQKSGVTVQDLASGLLPGLDLGRTLQWNDLTPAAAGEARRIGRGISSDTFAMEYRGRPVAVKVLGLANNKTREPPKRTLKFVFNEIRALRLLDHPNVIHYVGAGAVADKVFVALELADAGCLARFLSGPIYRRCVAAISDSAPSPMAAEAEAEAEAKASEEASERWQWATTQRGQPERRPWGPQHDMILLLKLLADVARGMAHLHERGVIHRDLSVDNVLIASATATADVSGVDDSHRYWTAKVADFGVCQVLDPAERAEREQQCDALQLQQCFGPHQQSSAAADEDESDELLSQQQQQQQEQPSRHIVTVRGNMRLYAPEATVDGRLYCPASDVFMFGMLMYEVLEGRQAYTGHSTRVAIKHKMRGARPEVSPALRSEQHAAYVELMQACWAHEPRARPTFVEVARRIEEQLAHLQ